MAFVASEPLEQPLEQPLEPLKKWLEIGKKKRYTRLRRFPEALEEARRVAGAENFRWMGWMADNQPFIIKYPLILSKMNSLRQNGNFGGGN